MFVGRHFCRNGEPSCAFETLHCWSTHTLGALASHLKEGDTSDAQLHALAPDSHTHSKHTPQLLYPIVAEFIKLTRLQDKVQFVWQRSNE